MNLIEQLGGYEKAKEVQEQRALDGLLHDYDWDLHSELLEYRRQHNIFEEGDVVTIPSRGDELFKVNRHLSRSDRDEMRHATDEEIKAGRRLD